MEAERLGYALLLSVPVGLGVMMGASKVTGRLLDPLVVGAGVVTTGVILSVLVASFLTDPAADAAE